MRSDFISLVGKEFGSWRVIAYDGYVNKAQRWICKCMCGIEKSVNGGSLKNGQSTNCGCLARISHRQKVSTHGMKKTRPYKQWSSMHERCKNWNKAHKERYFDRGILVCERWSSFENFWEDMKGSYQDGMTLDRIDNDSGYSPDNCRWTSSFVQARNRSTNRFYEMNGEKLCIRDWEIKFGLPKGSLYKKLNSAKSIQEAIGCH